MTKNEFRESLIARLQAEGVKKVKKDRMRRAVNRTNAMVRSKEGEVIWMRSYLKDAVKFYTKNV